MLNKHNIAGGIWLMTRDYAQDHLPLVVNYLKGNTRAIAPAIAPLGEELNGRNSVLCLSPVAGVYPISEYGEAVKPENAPQGSIAIIEIEDVITKYDQDCGPAGMVTKANILKRCYKTRNIDAIVLKIDSGGGEGYAMFHMAEAIAERNKPVYAFVSDFAASAAYGIASACDDIYCNMDLAKVGSVGAYITLLDYRKFFEKQGVNILEIYADQSKKGKNIEFREALNGNLKPLTEMLNTFTDKFINMVSDNRGDRLTGDSKTWMSGNIFYAKDAITTGLIDKICCWDDMMAEITTNIQNNNSLPMKKQPINLNAVLGVESLESQKDGIYLNEQQIETVDTELANRESTISTLTEERTAAVAAQQVAENNLTAAQAQAQTDVNAANALVSERDQQIVALNEQVATLQAAAGGGSRRIVTETDDQKGQPKTGIQGFFETVTNAREIYKSLPE